MPSTSKKQERFMAAAAHNPEFAAKAGIPVSVAKEFYHEDSSTGHYGREKVHMTPEMANKRKIAKALIKHK